MAKTLNFASSNNRHHIQPVFPLSEVKVFISFQCKVFKRYDRRTVGNLNVSQVSEIQRWGKKKQI